jgi:hypothetical protein
VHFFCQLVSTVIATGKVWKLVGIAEAHMRRTHARAGAIGVCDVPSIHSPMPPGVNSFACSWGAHGAYGAFPVRKLFQVIDWIGNKHSGLKGVLNSKNNLREMRLLKGTYSLQVRRFDALIILNGRVVHAEKQT